MGELLCGKSARRHQRRPGPAVRSSALDPSRHLCHYCHHHCHTTSTFIFNMPVFTDTKNSTRHPLMLVNLQRATRRLPPPRSLHKTCRRQIVFFFLAFCDFTVRFLDTIGYMHCFVIYLFAPIVIAFFLNLNKTSYFGHNNLFNFLGMTRPIYKSIFVIYPTLPYTFDANTFEHPHIHVKILLYILLNGGSLKEKIWWKRKKIKLYINTTL